MKIKEGTLLNVNHIRSGKWVGIATRDFDTDNEPLYPIALAQLKPVDGLITKARWVKGDNMPCRKTLCIIQVREFANGH